MLVVQCFCKTTFVGFSSVNLRFVSTERKLLCHGIRTNQKRNLKIQMIFHALPIFKFFVYFKIVYFFKEKKYIIVLHKNCQNKV